MNADSSVQLLAEEAVTLDMLDLGVSDPGKLRHQEAKAVQELWGYKRAYSLGGGADTRLGSLLALTCHPIPCRQPR